VTRSATCADRFFEDLARLGVKYVFANWGSEHPPLVEALARRKAASRRYPQPILCPHETVALSAAQGYAQLTGEPQAVIVHADVGTQNLGGAVHNVCRSRTPVLIFAGVSPYSVLGEEFGGRNEYQMVLQDVPDQHAIVRQYMKWTYHGRSAAQMPMVTSRAMEVALSEPTGPVYLSLSREVLEEPAAQGGPPPQPVSSTAGGLDPQAVAEVLAALETARKPVLITSYLGRKPETVAALVAFSEAFALPVIESFPHCVNFPASHPHHAGFHMHARPEPRLAEADLVLVVDSDFPWLPARETLRPGAGVFHIDRDGAKNTIPLWHIPRTRAFTADAGTALRQLMAAAEGAGFPPRGRYQRRLEALAAGHRQRREELRARESEHRRGGWPTVALLAAALREQLRDDDIVLNESITNSGQVFGHLERSRPGTVLGSGGSSLGWHGGAALGAKLAAPDRTVVSIAGDGSYIFSVPSATHWVAARYGLATLTIVLNNGGWNAPRKSTLAIHPTGAAARAGEFFNELRPSVDYVALGRATGIKHARSVSEAGDVDGAVAGALAAVREGRPALLEVQLEGAATRRV